MQLQAPAVRRRVILPCPPLPVLFTLTALTLLCLLLPQAAAGQQPAGSSVAFKPDAGGLPPLPPGAEQLPDVVARVDGDPISKRELLAQAQTMRIQATQTGAADPGQEEGFLSFVLEALIGERLVYADSQARGVGASEAEVDEKVEAIVAGYGGKEAFDKAMAEQGLDVKYVRRQIQQSLSIDTLMEDEVMPKIQISEEAIKGYYDRYLEQMKVPAYHKVRHIMKKVPESAGAEARQAARSQLQALRPRILGGEDFAALARDHSDDARTREEGGEMPWIVLTGREGSFEPAVAALAVGELSQVVETSVGLHLIQLVDRKPERVRTLDETRDEIGNLLAVYAARQEIQRRVEELKATAKVEILM